MSTPDSTVLLDYQPPTLTSRGALTQTWAMLVDSYRELNSKKLFWITMLLSGLVAGVFAAVGIDEQGVKLLYWHLPSGPWTSHLISPAKFYKYVFSAIAIPMWLAWAAMILAVVSTASIFPDFLSSGSVDLYLSRPLSRLRLFLTKYVMGLLFVGLQVFAFTAACFLVIGFRGGEWELSLFLAVPIVTAMFSFLFSLSVLFGTLTRSTIAAVMLTMLCWLIFWAVNTAESALLPFKEASNSLVARSERSITQWDKLIAGAPDNKDFVFQRQAAVETRDKEKETLATLTTAHNIVWWIKLPLPKNAETIDLLRRALVKYAELPGEDYVPEEEPATTTAPAAPLSRRQQGRVREQAMEAAAKKLADNRSVSYTLGTSFAFEAMMLGLAALVFCRRDY